ncbi:MAG: toll/interleukin-1 receptor domain-containing protein [Armatimonadetes bacterium]|nr:toll/interleukin-1 receptor domain-containing protein [Anaerolineae bacterium]
MSHIFISYAHDDKTQLTTLLGWLHTAGFADHELWYDQTIEGGNNWRDEIASALDESFTVLVVVTAKSVKSVFCTYEWAYAMGQGIPVLPLVFDEVQITDVPSPLATKQFTNCKSTIPEALKQQIEQLRSIPPQVAAMNKQIYEAVYRTHRRFFILGWLGQELESVDYHQDVMTYFAKESISAHRLLETLMIDKAFVFTRKQYQFCRKLITYLEIFSHIQLQYNSHLPEYLALQFDTEWLPAFEYFAGDSVWRTRIRPYFERDLSVEDNKMEVFAEMIRAFPPFTVEDVNFLIQNMTLSQKRSEPTQDFASKTT